MHHFQLKIPSRRPSFYSRPNTARVFVHSAPVENNDFKIVVNRLIPRLRKPIVHEVSTSPLIFPEAVLEKPSRRRIIIVKNKPQCTESPSLMVAPDIVGEYEKKIALKRPSKKKCPLSFLALPLPFGNSQKTEKQLLNTQKYTARRESHHVKLLKRQFSDSNSVKRPQRMFDYNEILNITSGKLNFK